MSAIVYALVDPCTRLVRYVGKSVSGLSRPRSHANPSKLRGNGYKERWIKTLQAHDLEYEIAVLEEAASNDALPALERFWIAYGRACGWPLTNATDGGDGLHGFKHTVATRAKMSAAATGRVMDPSVVERVAAQLRGRTVPADVVARRAAAQTGARRSETSKAKMSILATLRERRRAFARALPLFCLERVATSLTDEQWQHMLDARAKAGR